MAWHIVRSGVTGEADRVDISEEFRVKRKLRSLLMVFQYGTQSDLLRVRLNRKILELFSEKFTSYEHIAAVARR